MSTKGREGDAKRERRGSRKENGRLPLQHVPPIDDCRHWAHSTAQHSQLGSGVAHSTFENCSTCTLQPAEALILHSTQQHCPCLLTGALLGLEYKGAGVSSSAVPGGARSSSSSVVSGRPAGLSFCSGWVGGGKER